MRDTIRFFLQYVCFILTLVYLITFYGYANWFCDLLSHFKMQYAVIIFLISVVGSIVYKFRMFALFFIVSFIILFDIQPWFHDKEDKKSAHQITVSSINLYSKNTDYLDVINYVKEQDHDLVVFTEYTQEWHDTLLSMFKIYPHRLVRKRTGNFGIAVYSKHKFVTSDVYNLFRVNIFPRSWKS